MSLYLARLGPFTELFGVVLIAGIFALLRSQADRRPYFRRWERSWLFIGIGLLAGLVYERLVDPDSMFYPASPLTTQGFATTYIACRLVGAALLVNGAQLFTSGTSTAWLPKAVVPVAIALTFAADTTRVTLAPLSTIYAPVVFLCCAYAAYLFTSLPASRRSVGTRLAVVALVAQTLLAAGLAAFYVIKHGAPSMTENPWVIRFARYGFYSDLLLQLLLAFAMVRLLVEDGRHEADDTRAHLRLMHDRDKLGDLYDDRSRLLARRAFDAMVGMDFARASFGSVAHVKITNFARVTADHGIAVSEPMLANLAGVLDSAVRTHDRVFRWSQDELLVIMPRAVPGVARSRVEFLTSRAAPLVVSGVGTPIRAEIAVSVRGFRGGEDLAAAATEAAAK